MQLKHLALIAISLAIGCKAKEKLKEKTPSATIVFGSGGGFTGMYNTYHLTPDCQLLKIIEESEPEQVKQIPKEVCEEIFNEIEALNIKDRQLNQPGNITNYLGIIEGDTEHKLSWGAFGYEPDDEIVSLYNKLNELIRE